MKARKVFEGKHVVVLERDEWEFIERKNAKEAVVIVATTEDDRIVLTEQFRPPVNARVIDFPTGIIEKGSAEETAIRELEEETGYDCSKVELLISGPSSPGITSELVHFFRARKVSPRGKGGGVEGEEITVHTVPQRQIPWWIHQKKKEGLLVDLKVWVGLYFASQST